MCSHVCVCQYVNLLSKIVDICLNNTHFKKSLFCYNSPNSLVLIVVFTKVRLAPSCNISSRVNRNGSLLAAICACLLPSTEHMAVSTIFIVLHSLVFSYVSSFEWILHKNIKNRRDRKNCSLTAYDVW